MELPVYLDSTFDLSILAISIIYPVSGVEHLPLTWDTREKVIVALLIANLYQDMHYIVKQWTG